MSENTRPKQKKKLPKPPEVVAMTIQSPNQLKVLQSVAYITRYKLNSENTKPNQTKPTQNFTTPSEVVAMAILSLIELKFSQSVVYITRYKLMSENTKPN